MSRSGLDALALVAGLAALLMASSAICARCAARASLGGAAAL